MKKSVFLQPVLVLCLLALSSQEASAGWWQDLRDWFSHGFTHSEKEAPSDIYFQPRVEPSPQVVLTPVVSIPSEKSVAVAALPLKTAAAPIAAETPSVPALYLPLDALADAVSAPLVLVGRGKGLYTSSGVSCLFRNSRILVFSEACGPTGMRTRAAIRIYSFARGQVVLVNVESAEGAAENAPPGRLLSALRVSDYVPNSFSVVIQRIPEGIKIDSNFQAFLAVNNVIEAGQSGGGRYLDLGLCAAGGIGARAAYCDAGARIYTDQWVGAADSFLHNPSTDWQRLLATIEGLVR